MTTVEHVFGVIGFTVCCCWFVVMSYVAYRWIRHPDEEQLYAPFDWTRPVSEEDIRWGIPGHLIDVPGEPPYGRFEEQGW